MTLKDSDSLPSKYAVLLAALTGVFLFAAYPPRSIWPLAFITNVPLLIGIQNQTPKRAALLGLLAGFTMVTLGFSWLYDTINVFGEFPAPISLFFMLVLCAYQGGRFALGAWLYARAERHQYLRSLAFVCAFVASEILFPMLFPWYFGACAVSPSWIPHRIMQVADLGGPIAVGLVFVLTNVAIAELIIHLIWKKGFSKITVSIGAIVPIIAILYGSIRIQQISNAAANAPIAKVGMVQPNLKLFDRRDATGIHLQKTKELKEAGVDLVVWSEAAIPRSFVESRYRDEIYKNLTQNLGVATIVGTVIRRPKTGDMPHSQSFNTALMADETGQISSRYDKQFLLAFGEYLPFGEMFPSLYKYSPNSGRFTPGNTLDPLVWKDYRISVFICYEDIIPEFIRDMTNHANPDLFVNMTNDAWFGDTAEPWVHLALAQMRSVEHRRYMVRTTNSGVSAFIDATGNIISHTGTFRLETLIDNVRIMKGKTVYSWIGNAPWYLITLLSLWMAFRRRTSQSVPSQIEVENNVS